MITVLPPPELLPPDEFPPHAARANVATATRATTRIGFAMSTSSQFWYAPEPGVLAPIAGETTIGDRPWSRSQTGARFRLGNDSDTSDHRGTQVRMQSRVQITFVFLRCVPARHPRRVGSVSTQRIGAAATTNSP